ncbi:MAG TPA: hybrid sensor histidine kinase/response regulator [Chloroflexi bacterium]|nr:hybrid sensor histidine kinase/response regulator [Chloroflexota bacterium]
MNTETSPPPKQTVLIAEDEKALAKAIAATLDLEGLETIIAYDGEQALALARAMQPDMILLDIMMPGRSGIEVCATLKTDPETCDIPVVFVTAKGEKMDRKIGIAAGAVEYLTKPFSPTELIALVKEVLTGQLVEPHFSGDDISAIPADQLEVFALEWRDLYEREREERRSLELAQKRLSELDRLKAGFLSAVTHELMTPFASIGIALQVLQRQREDLSTDVQNVVDDLSTEIEQLHRLVNGVVKFAELVNKRREPQPSYVSLHAIIPDAVQPASIMAQARQIDFQISVPEQLSKVYVDPELLGEAVFQMAHNAVKFNAPGGKVQIHALEVKGWLTIEISDTGVGLTPERLELLGQPFEQDADTLRRGREGLGVGWAFVRYVAKVHGGRTQVQSPGPNQGSIFRLALPVVAGWHEINAGQETDLTE